MNSGNGKPGVRGSVDELHRRLDLMGVWGMGPEKRKHLGDGSGEEKALGRESISHLCEGMEAGTRQLQSRLG